MATCAFIGLGNMGYPMAGHLVSNGHSVRVFNRTASTATRWAEEFGGMQAASPAEAAEGADFVMLCVGKDDDVRSVCYGDTGFLNTLVAGAVVIDHTTTSALLALEMAEAVAERQAGFIDGPVSGGQAGAEHGQLSIMCGGLVDHFELATPILESYGSAITLIGGISSGQQTKMVNQILCAGAIQGAAEALAFGLRAGLDMELVLSAVTQGAAGSWYLSNRGQTMVADEFDFGFAVDHLAKDLGIVTDEAARIEADLPLTELTASYLTKAQSAGDNRMDATSIIRRYRAD